MNNIASLREVITSRVDPARAAKMEHAIPELPTVKNRGVYLVAKAKDRIVLDIGCTGNISAAIRASARKYYGIDRVPVEGAEVVELDHRPDMIPKHEDVDLVIASEILEHLSNPGYFLLALKDKYPGRECYITVPNAGAYQVIDGREIVNAEHVCWYSYQTLYALLTRYGIEIVEARWHNGEPVRAEGIIAKVKL